MMKIRRRRNLLGILAFCITIGAGGNFIAAIGVGIAVGYIYTYFKSVTDAE